MMGKKSVCFLERIGNLPFSVFFPPNSLSGDFHFEILRDESFSPLWWWKLLVKIDFNSGLEAAGAKPKAYAEHTLSAGQKGKET